MIFPEHTMGQVPAVAGPWPFSAGTSSEPAGGTSTIEREELRELQEPGDHERFAHYVRKEKIMESAVSGEPVIALCGKVWVPGRDPSKFPVCPTCQEIYDGLRAPNDDNSSGTPNS